MASASANGTGTRAKATAKFTPRKPGQLELTKGQEVTVLDDAKTWWQVRNDDGVESKAPFHYLVLIESETEPEAVAVAASIAGPDIYNQHWRRGGSVNLPSRRPSLRPASRRVPFESQIRETATG